MAELRVIVAGLAALLIQQDEKKAAGVLLRPRAGVPKHWPILLIPKTASTDLPVIEKADLARRLSQLNPNVVGELGDYQGIDVTDADIEVRGEARNEDITQNAGLIGTCPENGDWSDLGWLMDLNKAHKAGTFVRETTKAGDTPIERVAMISWSSGELRGHAPVEKRRKTKIYQYEEYKSGNVQAFTDAFEWRAKVSAPPRVVVRKGGAEYYIDVPDVSLVWLLHLPGTPSSSSHFEHTEPLPFAGSHPKSSPTALMRVCEGAVTSAEQTGHYAGDKEISVTISVKGPNADAIKVALEVSTGIDVGARGNHVGAGRHDGVEPGEMLEERGDSMCMGRKLTVDRI